MSEPFVDVSRTVEYSMDKWLVDRVPWGMWACVAGLAVVLHAESRVSHGAVLGIVYLGLLGLAFAGFALTTLIGRSGLPFLLDLLVSLLVMLAIAALVYIISLAVSGLINRSGYVGGVLRNIIWSNIVRPPPNVFGWMLIYLGLGWIAFAFFRHLYADRAIVTLSPAGIQFHRSWLKGLFIPWQDVHGVGHLEISYGSGTPFPSPHAAVVVGKDFYERHIAPKRSFFSPPGAKAMFWPKGEMMQVVLNSGDVTVKSEDFLGPVEARWKAFRDQPRLPPYCVPAGTPVVYGRWSIDGSRWQAIQFLAPLVGMVAVVLHAIGAG